MDSTPIAPVNVTYVLIDDDMDEAMKEDTMISQLCNQIIQEEGISLRGTLTYLLGINQSNTIPREILIKILRQYVLSYEPRTITDTVDLPTQFNWPSGGRVGICIEDQMSTAPDLDTALGKAAARLLHGMVCASQHQDFRNELQAYVANGGVRKGVYLDMKDDTKQAIFETSTIFGRAHFPTSPQPQSSPLPLFVRTSSIPWLLRHLDLNLELPRRLFNEPQQLFAAQDYLPSLKRMQGCEKLAVLHVGIIEHVRSDEVRIYRKRDYKGKAWAVPQAHDRTSIEDEMEKIVESMRTLTEVELRFSLKQFNDRLLFTPNTDSLPEVNMIGKKDKEVVEVAMDKNDGTKLLIENGLTEEARSLREAREQEIKLQKAAEEMERQKEQGISEW